MKFRYDGPLPAHTDYSAQHGARTGVLESFEFKPVFELKNDSEIQHALILVSQGILSLDKPDKPDKPKEK